MKALALPRLRYMQSRLRGAARNESQDGGKGTATVIRIPHARQHLVHFISRRGSLTLVLHALAHPRLCALHERPAEKRAHLLDPGRVN